MDLDELNEEIEQAMTEQKEETRVTVRLPLSYGLYAHMTTGMDPDTGLVEERISRMNPDDHLGWTGED